MCHVTIPRSAQRTSSLRETCFFDDSYPHRRRRSFTVNGKGSNSVAAADNLFWTVAVNTFWIMLLLVILVIRIPSDSSTSCPVHELETTLQQLQQSEQQLYDAASSIQSRRVLIAGLVGSLQEVFQHTMADDNNNGNNVVDSIIHLCSSVNIDKGGEVEINILYKDDHNADFETGSPHHFQTKLRELWEMAGCTVTLLSEHDALLQSSNNRTTSLPGIMESMSRFQRLAKLRSLQRTWILSRQQEATQKQIEYDVVVNIDFDVMTLPKPSIVNEAIAHVYHAAETDTSVQGTDPQERHGSIVCANGFEVWKVPFLSSLRLQQPHLYYDTLAAIDHQGDWYYPSYSCNVLYIISLAQWTLFQKILFFPSCRGSKKLFMDKAPISTATSTLWPMQSCFGGLAIYDWGTWAFPECDYDASQITLVTRHDEDVKKEEEEDKHKDSNGKWQLSPKYTLTGTKGGDTCEHVVFQQCLRAASQAVRRKLEFGGKPSPPQQQQLLPRLEVGIMSDFVVEREASLLSTRAAQQKTFLIVMGVLATLVGLCRLCTSRWKR
jgi:hypothetical protein